MVINKNLLFCKMSSADLEQLKRARDEMFNQMPPQQQMNPGQMPNPTPMPHPEDVNQQGDESDKNPELINSILRNYNSNMEESGQQPQMNIQKQQQQQMRQQQQMMETEQPEMDLRDIETMEENVEEFASNTDQVKYFNYIDEIKKVVLTVSLIVLFFNPMTDKFIYRYIKKVIFTGDNMNWYGIALKAVLVAVIVFGLSNFVLRI
jgi:hypothetical protein